MACVEMYNNMMDCYKRNTPKFKEIIGDQNYKLLRIATHDFTLPFDVFDRDFDKILILTNAKLIGSERF